MNLARFHNALRILLSVDMPEFIGAGGTKEDWPKFRDDPHKFFIRADDKTAQGLWKIICRLSAPEVIDRELTGPEADVIEAAMELSDMHRALDHGVPAQAYIARAERALIKTCSDLAAEGDGTWRRP